MNLISTKRWQLAAAGLFFLVLGSMAVHGALNPNPNDLQAVADVGEHPLASVVGSLIPASIGSVLAYWSSGRLMRRIMARYKPCPHCASTIAAEAIVCRHCSRDVARPVGAEPAHVTGVTGGEISTNAQPASDASEGGPRDGSAATGYATDVSRVAREGSVSDGSAGTMALPSYTPLVFAVGLCALVIVGLLFAGAVKSNQAAAAAAAAAEPDSAIANSSMAASAAAASEAVSASALAAQHEIASLSVNDGNVIAHVDDGTDTQISSAGLDSVATLSPDRKLIAFVRLDRAASDGGEPAQNSLWTYDRASGVSSPFTLFDAPANGSDRVTDVSKPVFSLDGHFVYVMSGDGSPINAIYQINVSAHLERFVANGNSIAVIRSGPYRGNLLVHEHKYLPAGGSYNPTYVVRPDGFEMFMVPGTDVDDDVDRVTPWLQQRGWQAW